MTTHVEAKKRFAADPSKCYQRHIRELYAEHNPRPPIERLVGAAVERISKEQARTIILNFEWLETMASATVACYGLVLNGELLGVACFSSLGGKIRHICVSKSPEETRALAEKTICLARGACLPHAPKNAASFLTRHACMKANADFGWKIFFAYSDADAGEIGTIYQASNWFHIGDNFRKGKYHTDYRHPDGRVMTSYAKNHKHISRAQLLAEGWIPIARYNKRRYVWFEGTPAERRRLKSLCRYPFLPYPKRVSVESADFPEVSQLSM